MSANEVDHSERHAGCRALRDHARADGVSHPNNLPFLFIPENAESAVLLVHGFTASPEEMRLLGAHLANIGLAVLAVRLPGHGTSPKDLAHRRWEEWFSAVENGYQILTEQFRRVYGAGLSTGSLLLVALTLKYRIDGLVLLSPYLRVKHRLAGYAGWLRHIRPYHTSSKNAEPSPFYYHRRPVAGVHQINRLIKFIRPRLGLCTAPVLAINGQGDRTVNVKSGQRLVEHLGSTVKIYQCYGSEIPHVLTAPQNPLYREMFDLIGHYILELDHPEEFIPRDI
ncbi:MAG: alpha/beta fold hydrolase [Deltaproteobacteria bacterium]|jgi:carboxylesterase|nr:alpha/beta fold hydrolase [Deltaproteobacteria bacterium]